MAGSFVLSQPADNIGGNPGIEGAILVQNTACVKTG